MGETIHLTVSIGPDKGKQISVPSGGGRVGRSSKNDIVLVDPSMSRFHCRFYFKPGQGLWIADLGSANQTLVNGRPIQDTRLRIGDLIMVGDTVLNVVNDGSDEAQPALLPPSPPAPASHLPVQPAAAPSPESAPASRIDLGFGRSQTPGRKSKRPMLLLIAALMAILAGAVWVANLRGCFKADQGPSRRPVVSPVANPIEGDQPLELRYEKVAATSANIFRYHMEIGNQLMVRIDDIQNNRHVRRETRVDPELLRSLARSIDSAAFFDLEPEYAGVAPDVYEAWDLSVTIGRRTHRVRVLNRLEPDGFKSVREAVEEFGKNELGLAALALEPHKLVELAHDALLQGKKLYDGKEIRHENLTLAIKAFKEVEADLETVEPKPDFYAEAVQKRSDCERELQEKYENIMFLAERAIKLRDWKEAARHLQIIRQIVPDRTDERNKTAFKKLLDVERHLAPEK